MGSRKEKSVGVRRRKRKRDVETGNVYGDFGAERKKRREAGGRDEWAEKKERCRRIGDNRMGERDSGKKKKAEKRIQERTKSVETRMKKKERKVCRKNYERGKNIRKIN